MLLRRPRPDHHDTHFWIVGPLKICYWPGAKYMEGWCHRCGWSQFGFELALRELILWHLWDRHDPTPKPISKNVMPKPGR